MNNIEIKNKRTNTDIHLGDIFQNKKTGKTVRVKSAALWVEFVSNGTIMREQRHEFLSKNKFKRRS